MDPALYTAFAKGLAYAINRALTYDPGSQAGLLRLEGKCLALRFKQPILAIYLSFEAGQVQLAGYRDSPADCTLTGSAVAILGLLWRERHTLADSGVSVEGDVALLQKLQAVLADLDLDWEQALSEAMARVTGTGNAELFSHPVAEFLRGRGQWLRRQAVTMPDWLRDYLTEELRLLPSPHEISAFNEDVDEVRAATDRLEGRLDKFRQALDSKSASRD